MLIRRYYYIILHLPLLSQLPGEEEDALSDKETVKIHGDDVVTMTC
jgi:hypothetical protein